MTERGPETLPLEDEEEELNYPVAQALLVESKQIVETIVRKVNTARDRNVFDKVRRSLRSVGRLEPLEPLEGAAVDSTFPPEGGIELVGGLLVGIVAGYLVYRGAPRIRPFDFMVRALLVETEEEKAKLPLWAKLLERKLILNLLEAVERGDLDSKLILIDGEIVPYRIVFGKGKSPFRRKLSRLTTATIRKAEELGITIVGVIKRSYSHLLSALTGVDVPLNDKAIMSLLLDPLEYAVLGDYATILPDIVNRKEGVGKDVAEAYGRILVAFYKPLTGRQAVKVELLDYGNIGVQRILSMLASMTNPATGLPYPIDLVDEMVRFEARILELLRRRLVASLIEELGPTAAILLAHTNPEKRYVYEPRWIARRWIPR